MWRNTYSKCEQQKNIHLHRIFLLLSLQNRKVHVEGFVFACNRTKLNFFLSLEDLSFSMETDREFLCSLLHHCTLVTAIRLRFWAVTLFQRKIESTYLLGGNLWFVLTFIILGGHLLVLFRCLLPCVTLADLLASHSFPTYFFKQKLEVGGIRVQVLWVSLLNAFTFLVTRIGSFTFAFKFLVIPNNVEFSIVCLILTNRSYMYLVLSNANVSSQTGSCN